MGAILSRPVPAFDITAASFKGAASDLGEVIALLAGGVRPDPEVVSRLGLSLRSLQGFLLAEATQQDGRERLRDLLLGSDVSPAPIAWCEPIYEEVTT